jgi:hypothetical protein
MWLPWRRAAAPVPASTPAPAPLDARSRPAHWAGLPPIQRVVAEQPVVLESAAFEAGLQSWHSPTFLAPLEHLVSSDGPTGSADLARPQPYAPTADMPLRQPAPARAPSLQRVVASASASQSAGSPRPALLSAPAVDHPVMELRTEALPAADGAAAHVQHLQAESAVETAPLLGDRGDTAPDGPPPTTSAESTPDSLPTLGERPALDTSLSADAASVAMPGSVEPTGAAQLDTTPPDATPAVRPPAPTAWRTRPGGIGAPLREMPTRPSSAAQVPIQRSTSGPIAASTPASTSVPSATGLPISIPAADSPSDTTPAQGESSDAPTSVAMPLAVPTLGSASIGALDLPSSAADPEPIGYTASSDTSLTSTRVSDSADAYVSSAESPSPQRLVLPALGGSWREPASTTIQRRALVGEAPLRPFAFQASPDEGLPFASSSSGGPPAPPAPALQRLSVGTRGPATGQGSGVRLDTWAPVASAPIATLPSAGSSAPSSHPTASSWSMPSIASLTNITPPVSAWPSWTQSAARGQTSVATVSRLGLGEATPGASASLPEPAPVVSREPDRSATVEAINPVATVSREAEAATPAAASPPSSGATATAAAGPDLDDLARKLYDRLRGRLAAELRLDRERIGSLTDLRR